MNNFTNDLSSGPYRIFDHKKRWVEDAYCISCNLEILDSVYFIHIGKPCPGHNYYRVSLAPYIDGKLRSYNAAMQQNAAGDFVFIEAPECYTTEYMQANEKEFSDSILHFLNIYNTELLN